MTMLYTIKQIKRNFISLLFVNFAWGESAWDNQQVVDDFVKNLDENDSKGVTWREAEAVEWKLRDIIINDLKERDKYFIRNHKLKELLSNQWDEIVEAMKAYNKKVEAVRWETKRNLREVSTMEKNTKGRNRFMWIDIWENNKYDSLNKWSFNNLLKSKSLAEIRQLVSDIEGVLGKKVYEFTFKNILWLRNYKSMKPIIKKAWYDIKGYFWNQEAAWFAVALKDIVLSQDILQTWVSFREKIKVLFDYNMDSLLDNKARFYTRERQFVEAIGTEQEFNNLLANMWYNKGEFWRGFSENYYTARLEFKDRLWTILDQRYVLNPWDMLRNPNALRNFNEKVWKMKEEVSEVIEKHEKTKDLSPATKSQLKLSSVWILLWSLKWVWVTFDVREYTKWLIDNAGVWYAGWVFGIILWKNIYKSGNWRFSVDFTSSNLIPILSATWKVVDWKLREKDFKKLFPTKISWTASISIWAWISLWHKGFVWLSLWANNENTKEWMEKWVRKMEKVLDKVFKEIEDWKLFKRSSFRSIKANKAIYERLASLSKQYKWNIDWLKEWALNNYRQALYDNAWEWIHFSWISAWLVFAAWYLPTPIVLLQWQSHKTEWYEKQTYTSERNRTNERRTEVLWNIWVDFSQKVKSIEDYISYRIRYNKPAKEIINPRFSIEKRFQAIKNLVALSERYKNKKYTKTQEWVWYIAKSQLKDIVSGDLTLDEKRHLVSTLSQFIKVSKDAKAAKTAEKQERLNDTRAKAFDRISGIDTSNYTKDIFTVLRQAERKNEKIEVWYVNWVSFDVTSTIVWQWRSVKWIDAIVWPQAVRTVNWEVAWVELSQKDAKQFIEKMNIDQVQMLSKEERQAIKSGIENGSKKLIMYLDPIWENHRFLVVDKEVKHIDVFSPNFHTTNYAVGYMGDRKEKEKEPESETEIEDPEEPEEPETPETPDPETPDPETPDPETPDPETPDPETPDPETPDPDPDSNTTPDDPKEGDTGGNTDSNTTPDDPETGDPNNTGGTSWNWGGWNNWGGWGWGGWGWSGWNWGWTWETSDNGF